MIESTNNTQEIFEYLVDLSTNATSNEQLKANWFSTPLGPMIAIADHVSLYLLDFIELSNVKRQIKQLTLKTNAAVISGTCAPIISVQKELEKYFAGKLQIFNTPIKFVGTDFQQSIWHELPKIPYGKTCSYAELASAIGNPAAFRAAANANGRNRFSIIVPCHRVINTSGNIGGYGGGIARKRWLLDHEKQNF